MRDERGLSLGALAEIAGVSRRTIQMYLEGMAATLDVAMRLEDVLSESLALPVDPFAFVDDVASDRDPAPRLEGFERELFQRLQRLGYDVHPTIRSPFDALPMHETTTLLTGVGGDESALDRKADIVSNISHVVEKESVMFVVHRARMNTRGVHDIAREELPHAKDSDDEEEVYVAGLSAWEPPVKPPPCFSDAIKQADAQRVPVEGVDMDEATYTESYVDCVSALEVVLVGRMEKRLTKRRFRAQTPREFVL